MPSAFSELQWTLIGAGLLVVIGVWAYNTWQEYRQHKLAQRIFRTEQADALLPEEAAPARAADDELPVENERIEPTFAEPEDSAEASAPQESVAALDESSESLDVEPPAEFADQLIDCIAMIDATDMVAAPLLWAAQRKLLGALEGRLCWSGWDENSGNWKLLHAHDATSYRRLCGSLQIADRSGPLSESDLTCFLDGVQELAENFRVQVRLPVAGEVLAHARALDEFCASVDWRIGINVVNRDGLSMAAARLIDLATETDLWLKDDGLFHAEDAAGKTLFTLSQLGGLPFASKGLGALSLPGVTLSVDVPRVADGQQAFDRLLEVAGRLMSTFDGTLVDDQRAPLSDELLAAIRAKIDEFQHKMAAHQIPAGSRRAMRLYS